MTSIHIYNSNIILQRPQLRPFGLLPRAENGIPKKISGYVTAVGNHWDLEYLQVFVDFMKLSSHKNYF